MVPRSASAAVRSGTDSKATRRRPACQRVRVMVSGPRSGGSVSSLAPTAERTSWASVCTSTETSPPTPCARAIRPTTSCTAPAPLVVRGLALLVDVDEVDADPAATQRGHDRTQCTSGAPSAADHLAQVLRVHADLEHLAAAQRAEVDLYVVRMIDDAPDQVVERVLE